MAFEFFPYTNFHDLNLDWVLRVVKKLNDDYDNLPAFIKEYLDNNPDIVKAAINEYVDNPEFTKKLEALFSLVSGFINVKHPPEGYTAATGDGVTDDTAAIENLAAIPGACLFFPAGVYSIKALAFDCDVFGAGVGAVQLLATDTKDSSAICTITGRHSFMNLTINANRQGMSENRTALHCTGSAFVSCAIYRAFDSVLIEGDGGNYNILMDNCTNGGTCQGSKNTILSTMDIVTNGDNSIISGTRFRIPNVNNPVYSKPSPVSPYFGYIPATDIEGNEYKILTATDSTGEIAPPATPQRPNMVNIRDFGAVGNASFFDKTTNKYWADSDYRIPPTDDSAALDAALEYAGNNNIDTIYFPDGDYYFKSKEITIDTSKVRFLGETKSTLVSEGLATGKAFITLKSPVDLKMYDYARTPLTNITIAGSYFTDNTTDLSVYGVVFGGITGGDAEIVSPHIALQNVTVKYFNVGVGLMSAYKSSAYNLNIIACNIGIYCGNTSNAIVPYNIYCAHIEACAVAIKAVSAGYSNLNIFGGAIEYCRTVYNGSAKVTLYSVRIEGDLRAACNVAQASIPISTTTGSGSPFIRFVKCSFLFLPNYVENVRYWVNNPYIANTYQSTAFVNNATNLNGKAQVFFENCEFSLESTQFPASGYYFVNTPGIYADANIIIGGLTGTNIFNSANLKNSAGGLL